MQAAMKEGYYPYSWEDRVVEHILVLGIVDSASEMFMWADN